MTTILEILALDPANRFDALFINLFTVLGAAALCLIALSWTLQTIDIIRSR